MARIPQGRDRLMSLLARIDCLILDPDRMVRIPFTLANSRRSTCANEAPAGRFTSNANATQRHPTVKIDIDLSRARLTRMSAGHVDKANLS
jgi:hypothetical protein